MSGTICIRFPALPASQSTFELGFFKSAVENALDLPTLSLSLLWIRVDKQQLSLEMSSGTAYRCAMIRE